MLEKRHTIKNWKKGGLVDSDNDNYEKLYIEYLLSTHCNKCNIEFGIYGDKTGTYKCMDHDHNTGLFRSFICHKCNDVNDRQKNKNNTSGYPNVNWDENTLKWRVRIRRGGKCLYHKRFIILNDAIKYRKFLKDNYGV